jgi:hypothetical protein
LTSAFAFIKLLLVKLLMWCILLLIGKLLLAALLLLTALLIQLLSVARSLRSHTRPACTCSAAHLLSSG